MLVTFHPLHQVQWVPPVLPPSHALPVWVPLHLDSKAVRTVFFIKSSVWQVLMQALVPPFPPGAPPFPPNGPNPGAPPGGPPFPPPNFGGPGGPGAPPPPHLGGGPPPPAGNPGPPANGAPAGGPPVPPGPGGMHPDRLRMMSSR